MPRDCPHSRCSYLLSSPTAICPACGRQVDSTHRAWVPAIIAAIVAEALLLLPVQSTPEAGIAILSVASGAVVIAVWPSHRQAPFTTLQDRYQQAFDDAQRWLEKWSELYSLRNEHSGQEDERLLLDEALGASEDAAAEAITRRNSYANRFIANGFERLDFLIAARAADFKIQQAIAIIERYLDTLWIDQRIAQRWRDRLAETSPTRRRTQVLQLAGSVALLSPNPSDVVIGDLDTNRFRLRAERTLLRESPLADADGFSE